MRQEQFIQSVQRQGYQTIPVDVELCESQIRQFEKRFGHTDYLTFFGQLHRPVEMDVKKNFENAYDHLGSLMVYAIHRRIDDRYMMEDEKAAVLLDLVTDFSCRRAEAGADVLGLGDDIGTQKAIMIDQDLWRKWLQPRLKKVIDAAKAIKPDILIFYHSCGYILPFIDELIETGVEILNPIQPESMHFNEIHDVYGERVSFWGTLGTQQLLPFGAAEEVYATTIDRLKICGPKGGIVIGPTHLVEPEVPWKNLEAIKQAVADFKNQ
jgi:uroporphyrinogen-III decarboxylase